MVVVLVAIGIVVVVVLFVSGVSVVVGLAADAGLSNNGSLSVRNFNSGELLEVVGLVGGGEGTGIIGEESEADVTSLLRAVGSKVVNNIVGIVVEIVLGTLEVVLQREGCVGNIVPIAGVGISIGILTRAKGNIHTILVVTLGVAVPVGRLVALLVTGVTVSGTLVLLLLHLPGDINLKELDHVHNVLSVILGASHGESIVARVGGTEAESDEALGLDARVAQGHFVTVGVVVTVFIVVIHIRVPLSHVMASQELDGVVRHEGHIVGLTIGLLHTTRVGDEVTAEGGVGRDALRLEVGEILLHFGGEGGFLGGG